MLCMLQHAIFADQSVQHQSLFVLQQQLVTVQKVCKASRQVKVNPVSAGQY